MRIELDSITRRFGSLTANDAISFTVEAGRIVGVLGENGAGKSTLMKILSGFQPADSGHIRLDGQTVRFRTPQGAIAHGVGMLHQDPLDVAAFSVLENFMYGQSGKLGSDRAAARARLQALTQPLGFVLEPSAPVATLSVAQRQQLEIVRLLALGVRVLILDEPTTGISADQKARLFDTLKLLASQGMTILLVSHKLEDVLALCHEAVVLRQGRLVGRVGLPADPAVLVALMFEQALTTERSVGHDVSSAAEVLRFEQARMHSARLRVEPLSLAIRAGEVVGLAGLEGSGQGLILRASVGLHALAGGRVLLKGKDFSGASFRRFQAHGATFAASGRLEEGLVAGMTVSEHFALASERGTLIRWPRVFDYSRGQINRYNIKAQPVSAIESLSGGNQQRVLLAMLPEHAQFLALEQPTRGLDVESAAWVWSQLLARREQGCGLLFSSDDLDELLAYADRIVVCFAGQTRVIDNNSAALSVDDLGTMIGGALA